LAVTFTNKAAREMRARLEELVGARALERLSIGTFHATCARFLRIEAGAAPSLDFDERFVIFDSDDQLKVIKRILRELEIDEKQYRPRAVLGAISTAKNEMLRPREYNPPTYWHEVAGRVYERYQALLRTSNALDFDDLLLETATLLRDAPEVRDKYRARWQHLLVDEFQDTNTVQYQLVRGLAAAEIPDAPHNLFVVGDEDQSIYRWRGADYRNIQRFRRDFPAARTVLLEQNYRSTQRILDAAQAVIESNTNRTPKELWTEADAGAGITLFEAYDEGEEAAYVVRRIEQMCARGRDYRDFAVMYRTNAQSRALEDALVRRGIAYQLVGATRFYDRREVRDALAFLRLAHNPLDEVSLQRVINVPPRGIGLKAQGIVRDVANAEGVAMWPALQRIVDEQIDFEALGIGAIPNRTRNALAAFHDILVQLLLESERLSPSDLLGRALELSGYATWLRDGTEEGEDRWQNLLELRGVAEDFSALSPQDALAALLESVALVADVDSLAEDGAEEEAGGGRVTLLTLHSAKGLEYPVVFITGLEEDSLPHSRSTDDPEALEEERRLFYVGITRAREKLHLIHAFRRAIFGASAARQPSRFLSDLPAEVLGPSGQRTRTRSSDSSGGGRSRATGGARDRQTEWSPKESPKARPARVPQGKGSAAGTAAGTTTELRFRAGDKVQHGTFGPGVVVTSSLRDGEEEVTVAFTKGGVKKLLQSFARLEPR
jgi:DNA helicase-2/ATP-dependent DNA helicase PcrA